MTIKIQVIEFDPEDESITLTFLDSGDVRGQFARRQQLRVPGHDAVLETDVARVVASAEILRQRAVTRWQEQEPVVETVRRSLAEELDVEGDDDATATRNWDAIERGRLRDQGPVPADGQPGGVPVGSGGATEQGAPATAQ